MESILLVCTKQMKSIAVSFSWLRVSCRSKMGFDEEKFRFKSHSHLNNYQQLATTHPSGILLFLKDSDRNLRDKKEHEFDNLIRALC